MGVESHHENFPQELSLITREHNLPPELNISAVELEKRLIKFGGILHSITKKFFSIETKEVLKKPEILASIYKARNKYIEWGEKLDIDLLIFLLKKRIESHNQENEVLYTIALDKIDQISSNQLKILVLIQTKIGLLPFLNTQKVDETFNLNKLKSFLKPTKNSKIEDIDHLKSLGILIQMFPYKWENIEISSNSDLIELQKICMDTQKNIDSKEFDGLDLSPVGRIIASSKIRSLINSENIGFLYTDKSLADLEVNEIEALGNIRAYSQGQGASNRSKDIE